MANYASPSIQNLTAIFEYANTITGSMFGVSIVLMTFIISFISMMRFQMEHALLSSMFITFVIATLLWAAGLVASQFVIWIVVALAGIIVMQWFNSN